MESTLLLTVAATGKRKKGNVFLSSGDRLAIDAVGVVVRKVLGSNSSIMNRKIFEQEQIYRAVELGIGASSPLDIEILAADEESDDYRDQVVDMLLRG